MSNAQVQQFQMRIVRCNQADHQGKCIMSLCLNPGCKESSTLCSKCLIKGHLQCRNQVYELEDIPKYLVELRGLQLAVVVFQQNINNQFKELLSRIEQILLPLSRYQDSSTLSNLNGIGLLLRQLPKQSIFQSIDETKIQIRNLLGSLNYQEERVQDNQEQIANNWFNKGFTLGNQGKHDEAVNCFEKAIEINPINSDYWNWKGLALGQQGKHELAIKSFERAIQISPKNGDYWFKKGLALGNLGKHSLAINSFDEAIKFNPLNGDYYNSKGLALRSQGLHDQAIKCFEKAIQIKPEMADFWNNKGVTLEYQGKYEEAIEYFEQAIQISPSIPSIKYNLLKAQTKLMEQQEKIIMSTIQKN